MKKIGLIFLTCIFFSGCGIQNTQNATTQIRFDEVSDSKIVSQISGMSEWEQIFNTIYEKTQASDLVVLGEVKDYTCCSDDGQISTHVFVQVDEVLKGDVSQGDTIELYNLGGIVTVEEYVQSLRDSENSAAYEDQIQEFEENYTEQEQKENYVQCTFCDLDPVIGQKSVYFLEKDSENAYYYRLNDAFGQLVETSTNEFKSAYGIADDKLSNDEPAYLSLNEDYEESDLSPEPLQSWNLDDIKHDMVTESEYTTEFPQAPEDMEISSVQLEDF